MAPTCCLFVVSMKEATFEELAACFSKQVKGACNHIHALCGQELCEPADLVQEAHLRLWQRRSEVAHATHQKTYVARLAKRAALNYLARLRRSYAPPIDLMQFAGIPD